MASVYAPPLAIPVRFLRFGPSLFTYYKTTAHVLQSHLANFQAAAMHSISTRVSPPKLIPTAVRAGLFSGKNSE